MVVTAKTQGGANEALAPTSPELVSPPVLGRRGVGENGTGEVDRERERERFFPIVKGEFQDQEKGRRSGRPWKILLKAGSL